jgi:hypothetical protein
MMHSRKQSAGGSGSGGGSCGSNRLRRLTQAYLTPVRSSAEGGTVSGDEKRTDKQHSLNKVDAVYELSKLYGLSIE